MPFIEQIKNYRPINEQEFSDKKVILDYIKQFPDTILTRENVFAHLTSSGFIMNPEKNKVLMIHHNIYNTWAWTGGHADGDRDLLAIAIKEAEEETGVSNLKPLTGEIDSIDILPVCGHVKRGEYVSVHLHLNVAYILIADETSKLTLNEEETSGVKWLPADELEKYCSEPEVVEIYNKLMTKARNYKK